MMNTPPPFDPDEITRSGMHAESSIDIGRLRVPVMAWISALVVVIGGVISMTLVWAKTVNHAEDKIVHVDPGDRERGGGLAYKRDVEQMGQVFEKRMRRTVTSMELKCVKISGNDVSCKIFLPESSE